MTAALDHARRSRVVRPGRIRFAEAAKLLGVSRQCIGQWHASGRLRTSRYEGHIRHATVELRELETLLSGAAAAIAIRKAKREQVAPETLGPNGAVNRRHEFELLGPSRAVNRRHEFELVAEAHEEYARWLRRRRRALADAPSTTTSIPMISSVGGGQ